MMKLRRTPLLTLLILGTIPYILAALPLSDAKVILVSDQPVWVCFHTPDPSTLSNASQVFGSTAICVKPDRTLGKITVSSSGSYFTYSIVPGGDLPNLQHTFGIQLSLPVLQSAQYWLGSSDTGATATALVQGASIEYTSLPLASAPTATGYFGVIIDPGTTVTLRYLAIDKHVPFMPVTIIGKEYPKEYYYNEPPTVKILEPANLTVVGETFYLTFNATDPENHPMTCQVIVNGKQVINVGAVVSGEPVKVLVYPYIGKNYIEVICKDIYEAYGKATLIVFNEKPPVVAIADPKFDQLVFNVTTYSPLIYVGDDLAQYLTCTAYLDNNPIQSFTPQVNAGYIFYRFNMDLTNLTPGSHILLVNCTDQSGLYSYDQVRFYYATDPDQLEIACVQIAHGEWYGDHCCGDDPGEAVSTMAKGWPTPQAFDPTTCSIIDLQPGQCDDVGDCPLSGWYCTNETFREYRQYYCSKTPGELIGTCTYTITSTENCTTYGTGYFCSYGQCTTVNITPKPPTIEILNPQPYSTVTVPITKTKYNVTVKVYDDLSEALVCNATYDNVIINLGVITNNTIFNVTVPLSPNKTTYSVSIACMDKENLTASATVIFNVNFTTMAACTTDTDCGIDHWECISSTQRAYYHYYCDNGECKVQITTIETCPSGTYCVRGICTPTLTCSSDLDCPADEWVCVNLTHREYRDWYCDTNTGTCAYRVLKIEACPFGQCVQGYCVEPGHCPPPTYTCLDNTTKAMVVWTYDNKTYSCVGHMLAPETCPKGTICLYGRCVNETKPEPNRPPVINWKGFKPGAVVNVSQPVTIRFVVSDDNSIAVFVRVEVSHSPAETIYQGIVSSGQEVSVTYTPQSEGTYIVTAVAIDGYSAQTIYQTSFTAVIPTAAAAPTAPAPAPAPAAPGGAPAVIPPTPAKGVPIEIIIGILGAALLLVGGIIYYYYTRRGMWF